MSNRNDSYDLIYREAQRAIADQIAALDVIQTRTSNVMSAAAIVTGLLALRESRADTLTSAGLVSVAALLGIVLLTGIVLWPRREWRFHFRASHLQWNYVEGPRPVDSALLKRDLALHLEAYFDANAVWIDRFATMLSAAIALLFLDVAAVLLEIWRTQ